MKKFIYGLFLSLLLIASTSYAWSPPGGWGGGAGAGWSVRTDCSNVIQKGVGCYNKLTDVFYIGNGVSAVAVGGGTGDMLKSDNLSGLANNATALSNIGAAGVAQTFYFGSTQIAINRASAPLSLSGVDIDGTAGGFPATLCTASQIYRKKADNSGFECVSSLTGLTFGGFTATAGMVPLTDASGNLVNSFFFVAGPASTAKTKTFANADATVVEYEQGGTGNVITTGNLQGGINRIGTFASPITSTGAYTLTAANSYNSVLFYNDTDPIDLPAAAAGMNLCIYVTGTNITTVEPNGTDVIVLDGTALSAGYNFTIAGVAGNYVCMVADAANHWVTVGYKGTLTGGS